MTTARAGTAAATAGSNPNARIWHMITQALDGDVTKLADKLVWMPAHQGTSAIGYIIKSNGKRLSSIDYRANRLVDKLAAHYAKLSPKAKAGEKLVNDVKMAATSALATLGEITWAANNCKTKVRTKKVRPPQGSNETPWKSSGS